MLKYSNKYGNINILDSTIAKIVGGTATSCFGVAGMASKTAADSFASLLKFENIERGVDISVTDQNKIKIKIHVIMSYGVNIPAMCDSIKNKVIYNVETMTGAKVSSVSIVVESISK